MHIAPILRILFVFAGILALNRAGVPLGLALFAGGIAIASWAGHGLAELVADLGAALARPEIWLLMIVVALILELGRFMTTDRHSKMMTATARRIGGRHGRAFSVMTLPAVIGLVPMPGGALFSAPLVAQAVREDTWPPEWKAAVNYWFRHVWEYWWPLYPVVIVTLSIFHIETWKYMVALIPFSILAVISGYVFLVRPHLPSLCEETSVPEAPEQSGWMFAMPLFILLGTLLVFPPVIGHWAPEISLSVRKLLAMLLGMAIGLGPIRWHERNQPDSRRFSEIFSKKSVNILFTLAGVMIFQTMLDRSGLIPAASDDLIRCGIPLVSVVAILPFVAGLVTGLAIGYAGISFPLIIGLMGGDGAGLTVMATLVLAFGFGYAGMMLSPVHLCLVLTKDYFSATFLRIYLHIFPCILSLIAASIGLYALFASLGW